MGGPTEKPEEKEEKEEYVVSLRIIFPSFFSPSLLPLSFGVRKEEWEKEEVLTFWGKKKKEKEQEEKQKQLFFVLSSCANAAAKIEGREGEKRL